MWIPVRSTIGLALLIPKASGYCLMQIFVMWIVVQGVGAADKVWEAALSYLNRGGVIIQAQSNPSDALVAPFMNTPAVPTGAMTMLTGQVCMLGMQKQLENQRQSYLDAQQKGAGPCSGGNNQSTDPMSTFCKTAVPDFLSTVNAVTQQNNNKYGNTFSVLMPNFDNSSPFAVLNGMCGTITWNSLNSQLNIATPTRGQNKQAVTGSGSAPVGGITLTTPELETAQLSRAIAVQQMYMDLSTIAQIIINNDPLMSSSTNINSTTQPFSPTATQQFGVPYTANGSICTSYDKNCLSWGSDTSASGNGGGALFNGTEFLGAISDYNGIMTPTLNLIRQSADAQNNNDARKFIADANSSGWIMAGSYFFDLIALNGNAVTNSKLQDTNSGLDASKYTDNLSTPCANYPILCTWFNIKNASATTAIPALASIQNNLIGTSPPNLKADAKRPIVAGTSSSTVYGFINNSIMVQLPGQPGIAPLKFANLISFNVDSSVYRLSHADFDCGKVKIVFFSFCLGEMMGDLFYNYIFRYVYNFLLDLFGTFINQVVMAFIMIPLQGMSEIFQQGLKIIATPGVNPVVALAKMGAMYINFSGNLWLMLLNMAVTSALIPIFGIFIFALMSLAMPLILAWVGVMVTVGFTTSYYVPILPYMIFTFGSIAWLISVIEAMVAAPIVALGVTHPEGHDAFGKGEAAIMILMNVFLRPAMMIIGYISGIALCYVGVWILNAGFDHAISFIQGGPTQAHAAPGDLIDHIKGGYG
ncbi:MAG: type IVB secretion system protein DotA, partial [bacterium]|nr:type IVB secretion system protein DotA [bacterium]